LPSPVIRDFAPPQSIYSQTDIGRWYILRFSRVIVSLNLVTAEKQFFALLNNIAIGASDTPLSRLLPDCVRFIAVVPLYGTEASGSGHRPQRVQKTAMPFVLTDGCGAPIAIPSRGVRDAAAV